MGKLKQMANGRVYDENRNVIEIHSAKKDALLELVEELGSEQLLIAYEYNHDLEQICEALGADLPYLGAGVNERTALGVRRSLEQARNSDHGRASRVT